MPSDLTPINRPREVYEVDRPRVDHRAPEHIAAREKAPPDWPLPPQNAFVFNAGPGTLDIHWDSPALLLNNANWQIVGVNIYRAFDSEWGEFEKINSYPIGAVFYRDSSEARLEIDEDVSGRFLSMGDRRESFRSELLSENAFQLQPRHPGSMYLFKTTYWPIVKESADLAPADSPNDVTVRIDGYDVRPLRVYGETGEIELNARPYFNPVTKRMEEPLLPHPTSTTTVTYRHSRTLITNTYGLRIFYRLTTVALRDGEFVETPVDAVKSIHPGEVSNLNYIWKEAVRRNRWILEQGGERVKVYIRKWVGRKCGCWDIDRKISRNDCPSCWGTSIVGGYEGPFDIIIAPQDSPHKLAQLIQGIGRQHQYDVWTGPSPLVSTRDFIRKQNGDLYSIGEVAMPSNAGNVLQQMFPINLIPPSDVRYQIPLAGLEALGFPETRAPDFEGHPNMPAGAEYPMITNDPGQAKERERRSRTVADANIMSMPNTKLKGW